MSKHGAQKLFHIKKVCQRIYMRP